MTELVQPNKLRREGNVVWLAPRAERPPPRPLTRRGRVHAVDSMLVWLARDRARLR